MSKNIKKAGLGKFTKDLASSLKKGRFDITAQVIAKSALNVGKKMDKALENDTLNFISGMINPIANPVGVRNLIHAIKSGNVEHIGRAVGNFTPASSALNALVLAEITTA